MKKWRLILVLVLIAIFVTVIAISRIKNVDKTLKIESEIDLNIVKVKSYKGFTKEISYIKFLVVLMPHLK